MNLFFFSIIIPTFNSEKTLIKCLESITNQTFGDYEIILMDGRSIDTTIDIIKTWSLKYPAIRWISENDYSIYDAMNKGIKLARGKWLYFLGSDDTIYDNSVLQKIKNYIETNSYIDILYGNVCSPRFNGIYDGEFTIEKIYKKNISHQAIFLKKKVFNKTGLFNLKYKAHADWDHNFKWFLSKRLKHKHIDLVIANYADGGFSSLYGDERFYHDKNFKYLISGRRILDRKTKITFFKAEFKKALNTRHKKRILILLWYAPNILW